MLEVLREFNGSFQPVGFFSGEDALHCTFSYREDYVDNTGAHALSHSLPLGKEGFSRDEYAGFFDGLVAEGPLRTSLAQSLRISPSDFISLLRHLGSECIGALLFRDESSEVVDSRYIAFSEEEIQSLDFDPGQLSLRVLQATRLSLAGAQTKFGVFVDLGDDPANPFCWHKGLGAAPSTHIVKVADAHFLGLVHNELVCMNLAAECGLPAARVMPLSGHPGALVVERYDRVASAWKNTVDGHDAPLRLHQEDLCQALGWAPYLKYEIADILYARVAAGIIERCSSNPIADKELFARYTLFNYLVGNCDNHLKNHAFLYSADWNTKRFAPMYDIVSTTLLGFDRKMAFSVGDHIVIDDITGDDWLLFAHDVGLPEARMKELAGALAAVVPAALEKVSSALPAQSRGQLDLVAGEVKSRLGKIAF